MQVSEQYSINTKASNTFAVAGIDKRLVCKSYIDSDIVKMKEQVKNIVTMP